MPTDDTSLTLEQESPKLEKLRLSIKKGIEALDCGEYTEVDDEDLDSYLDTLLASARR
jgi:hypothetical protein